MAEQQMANYTLTIEADSGYESTTEGRCTAEQYGQAMAALHGTIPAAQPAVPDAMTSADIQEHIEYVAGWNDCRAEMLKENTP